MQLKTLSLNIWGVPFLSKYRRERIKAISDYININSIDIIGVQEIWTRDDYMLFINELGDHPYTYYFRSGIVGSGLAVFSKYPITEASIKRFSCNGKPQRIQHSDWLGGKAIGLCRILLPNGTTIDFYNTHLHARYAVDHYKDEYVAHRISQVWELAQFIRHTRRNPVVLVGDLNLCPRNLGYLLITAPLAYGGVQLVDAHVDTMEDPERMDRMIAELQSECKPGPLQWKDAMEGITCLAISNSFTHAKSEFSEKVDYTFYYPVNGFQLKYSRLALLGRLTIDGKSCSYSDHYGIISEFVVDERAIGAPVSPIHAQLDTPTSLATHMEGQSSSITAGAATGFERNRNKSVAETITPADTEKLPIVDVDQQDMIYAVTKILTWGIKDAINRHSWHFYRFLALLCVAVLFLILAFVIESSGGYMVILSDLIIVWICYEAVMLRFILPEEVSSIERVRSEVLVYIQGHIRILHPSIPQKIIRLLTKQPDPSSINSDEQETPLTAGETLNQRRVSLLDPGQSTFIRGESQVLLSGISNAISGSKDHPSLFDQIAAASTAK